MDSEILKAIREYNDGWQGRFVSNSELWHITALTPCPKCGCDDLTLCCEEWPGATMATWVSCSKCNYIGPIVTCQSSRDPDVQAVAAMEAWDAIADHVYSVVDNVHKG